MSRYCRAKQIGPQGIFPLPMSIVILLSYDRVRAGEASPVARPRQLLLSPSPARPCQGPLETRTPLEWRSARRKIALRQAGRTGYASAKPSVDLACRGGNP